MSILSVFSRPGASRSLKLLAATNIFGLVYFLTIFSAVLYLAYFYIVPQRYGNSMELVMKHFVAMGYIAVNVLGNFLNVIRTDSSINVLHRFPKIKDKDFKLECSKCERGVPRRSHHCPLCDTCVLKRDHHCFFMCTCIGYFNQKYFFMFCLYNTIGGVYGTILLAMYMHLNHKVVFSSFWSLLSYIPTTIIDWWFRRGVTPPTTNLLVLMGLFYASFLGFLLSAGILFWQVYIISQGQTTYEAKHSISKFTKSMKENFLDVFGPYWYINLFLPVMLPQKSDGTYTRRPSSASSKKKTSSAGPKKNK